VVDRLKEPTEVRLTPPVARALLQAHRHRVERSRRAAPRSTAIGESAQDPLGESVQHCHRGPRDAFIFQGREAEGPLAAGRLRAGHPRDRTRGRPPVLEAV
jgi:hypothetical protein